MKKSAERNEKNAIYRRVSVKQQKKNFFKH